MAAAPTDGDFNAKSHSMTRVHDADMRPGMYGPRPRGPMPSRYGQGFAHYPPPKYYHDSRMAHAPQPPHGPQPQYHGDYHDAPYHNSHDGYDGYVETYWHPPSSAYFGPQGRYQHGYGCEYPNEYPKDQED
ncbi:hypothetical protein BDR06DRAFT_1015096 [Suillus hirtellus]|nr:hypothetical protein BDR06DRAFT_1015096 [Suillus hirtellus]